MPWPALLGVLVRIHLHMAMCHHRFGGEPNHEYLLRLF